MREDQASLLDQEFTEFSGKPLTCSFFQLDIFTVISKIMRLETSMSNYSDGLKAKGFGTTFTVDVSYFVLQVFEELNSV